MPLRPKQNLDNLTYILSKDATSGAKAGFDVQRMRNRLTEIEYDINHIQGDVDNILGDVVTNIYNEINDLRSWVTEEFGDFKEWTQEELENLKSWAQQELERVDSELTYIKTNYEHFETGTRLLFYQAAAPSGWSIVPGLEDAAVRIVSVNGGAVNAGTSFPTVFKAQDVGNTTLTLNQIPAHGHSGSASSSGSHYHPIDSSQIKSAGKVENEGGGSFLTDSAVTMTGCFKPIYKHGKSGFDDGGGWGMTLEGWELDLSAIIPSSTQSAGSHTHSVSVGNTGGGGSHTHSIDLTVKHICVIVCQKEIVF